MFVRLKTVKGRRYAYLVEGVRRGDRVSQRVVCYIGPVADAAFGAPGSVRSRNPQVDWARVNASLRRMPLRFDELQAARLRAFPIASKWRQGGFVSRGTRERVEGEEEALCKTASARFGRMFAEVAKGRYRMK